MEIRQMHTTVRLAALGLTLAGGYTLAAEPEAKREIPTGLTEPAKCYRLIGRDGSRITVGQAVEVCAATPDAFKTVLCFEEAWGHPDDGGLGLTMGQAVDLCRTIPRERP